MILFKLRIDENDKVLYVFLTREFQEEKNQVVALKHDLATSFSVMILYHPTSLLYLLYRTN